MGQSIACLKDVETGYVESYLPLVATLDGVRDNTGGVDNNK